MKDMGSGYAPVRCFGMGWDGRNSSYGKGVLFLDGIKTATGRTHHCVYKNVHALELLLPITTPFAISSTYVVLSIYSRMSKARFPLLLSTPKE